MPIIKVFIALLITCTLPSLSTQAEETSIANIGSTKTLEHSTVTLLPETSTLSAEFGGWVAIHIAPNEGWYTAWRNGGDMQGEPTIEWDFPAGVMSGEAVYQVPRNFPHGNGTAIGFKGPQTIFTPLTFNSGFEGSILNTKAHIAYNICNDGNCITETTSLSYEIKVVETYSDFYVGNKYKLADNFFTQERHKLAVPFYGESSLRIEENTATLLIKLSQEDMRATSYVKFNPYHKDLSRHGNVANPKITPEGYELQFQRNNLIETPKSYDGTLLIHKYDGTDQWFTLSPTVISVSETATLEESVQALSIWQVIIFAMLGGLILNLMPCVFPVLSLKAFAILSMKGDNTTERHKDGWGYTLGILFSFYCIVGVMLLLKSSGQSIGWGFQLQSPLFVASMTILLLLVALSLAGFFHINFSFAGVGSEITRKKGIAGSFFTGFLATLVATPCTAPFMAPAIAFAITQSVPIIFMTFTALGLGLASPFILLCYSPALAHRLPKPGLWMDKVKVGLAFPMVLTAIWLAWVYGQQTNLLSMFKLLVLMTVVSFFIWLHSTSKSKLYKNANVLMVTLLLVIPFAQAYNNFDRSQEKPLPYIAYTPQLLEDYREDNKAVLLYFSADWCLNCKVGEYFVLDTDATQTLLKANNVIRMKVDLTVNNSATNSNTAFLQSFGRTGFPTYVYFPQNKADPIVLPNVISFESIKEAINSTNNYKG